MANDITTGNPFFFDTAGATSEVTDPKRLHSIVINPTAVSWAITIHNDSAGTKVVFKTSSAANEPLVHVFPSELATSLYVTTLTNCEAVVYLP